MTDTDSTKYLPRILSFTASNVRHRLIEWFRNEGREFPWRSVEQAMSRNEGTSIIDPYLILVSEVMLQQTQTARVAEKLPEFIRQFPDVASLAGASVGELLRAWRGMGYNSRALRLQDTARAIRERHGGIVPASISDLQSLPGVGSYTARAIACFAFGADVAVVDVNVIRVLSRLFFRCHTSRQYLPGSTIRRVAEALVPVGDSYRWHQALMDLGATICTARAPACELCPLNTECLSAFPMAIDLFNGERTTRPEPSLLGEPRRIWRGRIIELLRDEPEGIRMSDVIDRLVPDDLFAESSSHRSGLLEIAEALLLEGLIARQGVVREGGVQEDDVVALPT